MNEQDGMNALIIILLAFLILAGFCTWLSARYDSFLAGVMAAGAAFLAMMTMVGILQ